MSTVWNQPVRPNPLSVRSELSSAGRTLPELLAPAGSMDQLEAALLYGADAVYLGGDHSLRAARAFDRGSLTRARELCRRAGVRFYYCCNAFPRQKRLADAEAALREAAELDADAVIIGDAGVLRLCRSLFPHLPIHLSTQANTCNAASVAFWQEVGVSRVNLARELSLPEIYSLRRACPDMELECFVHGAQCLALSGQCLMSAWLNQRPANEGQCTQPCRFEYRPLPGSLALEEAVRRGDPLWDVTQGEEGYAAVWAPEDLCLVEFVPWLVRQKITALKIEGRMRTGVYVAHVVDNYRAALDFCRGQEDAPGLQGAPSPKERMRGLIANLAAALSRPLGTGFFAPRHRQLASPLPRSKGGHSPVLARVEEALGPGAWRVSVRGQWRTDTAVRVVLPGGGRPVLAAGSYALENHRGEACTTVHSGTAGVLYCEDADQAAVLAPLAHGVYLESAPQAAPLLDAAP